MADALHGFGIRIEGAALDARARRREVGAMFDTRPYEAETRGVIVRVQPAYLAGQSDPAEGRWIWAYQVEIENRGEARLQLMARRWTILDAHGRSEEVRGPGVVGRQPHIAPGETYSYASGCPLTTPSGSMSGAYLMVDDDGASFEVTIPTFSLDVPDARRVMN